jgi:competence protein ComGF
MDDVFFDSLMSYSYQTRKIKQNYFAKIIKVLKSFLSWAVEKNYTQNRDFEKFKATEHDIDIIFLTFEELMHLDVLNEKIEAISKINDAFVLQTPDGTDIKYFSLEFLIEKYLPELTEEDRKRNEKLLAKQEEKTYQQQITKYILQTIYDPMANLDPETGLPDTEAIAKLSKDIIKSKTLKQGIEKTEKEAKDSSKSSLDKPEVSSPDAKKDLENSNPAQKFQPKTEQLDS